MKHRPSTTLVAVFLILFSGFPSAQAQVIQTPNRPDPGGQNQASQERLEFRRQHFARARQLLLDKRLPFEPEQLLDDEWPTKLGPTLDAMPEMHEVYYERAPLSGAYISDTLYLPEKVQLKGDTVLLVNNLVFEGHEVVVKGSHSLHIFSTQPKAVLGTTLAQALRKKTQLLNVSLGNRAALPSFSLIRDLDQTDKHVTFDISGPEPQPAPPRHRDSTRTPTAISWNESIGISFQIKNDTSGDTGKTGTTGFSPGQAMNGGTPPKAASGKCGAVGGPAGSPGGDGVTAQPGGIGGPGGPGGDAAAQLDDFVADGDLTQYTYIARGGVGGQGGTGGNRRNGWKWWNRWCRRRWIRMRL